MTAIKWFAVDAGAQYSVSSDWYAKLPNISGEFKALVFTTDNISFNYTRMEQLNSVSANTADYRVTNNGGAGAAEFSGSFTTDFAVSQGYVVIAQKGWSYGVGGNEYKGEWSTRLYNTVIDVEPVPEPSSILALGTGLMGLAGFAIRRRK